MTPGHEVDAWLPGLGGGTGQVVAEGGWVASSEENALPWTVATVAQAGEDRALNPTDLLRQASHLGCVRAFDATREGVGGPGLPERRLSAALPELTSLCPEGERVVWTPPGLLSCCWGDLGRCPGQRLLRSEALRGVWSCGWAFVGLSLLWPGGPGAGE